MLISESFPNRLGIVDCKQNGIFRQIYLKKGDALTWFTESMAEIMNVDYYLSMSGDKKVSRTYERMYDAMLEDKALVLSELSKIIVLKFSDKWDKLHKAYIESTYNPIENYSMTEKENVGTKIENTQNASTSLYAFNSDDASPVNTGTQNGTSTGNKEDNERELTRSGNIGVTTSQQMMESEFNLRNKRNFYNEMMKDVDSIYATKIF